MMNDMGEIIYLPLVLVAHNQDYDTDFDDALKAGVAEMTDRTDHTQRVFDLL